MKKPSASGIWTDTPIDYIEIGAYLAVALALLNAFISFRRWRRGARMERLRTTINNMTDEGETR